jgi:hypothetical protein
VDPEGVTQALPVMPDRPEPGASRVSMTRFSNRIRRLGPQDISPTDSSIIPGFGEPDEDEDEGRE